MPQEDVPKAKFAGHTRYQSGLSGTQHTYWVYVPAQYDPKCCCHNDLSDGQAFKDENGDLRAQNVMDNLIYRREIR